MSKGPVALTTVLSEVTLSESDRLGVPFVYRGETVLVKLWARV